MRTLLFFDIPVLTKKQQRDYRHFVKDIMKMGFYRIQESVFVKMSIDFHMAHSMEDRVKKVAPKEGNIFLLTITEKQFSEMVIILGELVSDIESSDNRIIEI